MTAGGNERIDPARLDALRAREDAAFAGRTKRSAELTLRGAACMPGGVPMAWMKGLYRTAPLYVTHGAGPRFFDADGNAYTDFNVADLAATMGFGSEPVVRAVSDAAAAGAHFLLPVQAAIDVAEELSRRNGLPFWQFTLSASGANTEVIRIARAMTRREKIVVFGGHYHGHIDETLVEEGDDGSAAPGLMGLTETAARHTVILPFNDLDAAERTLKRGDVALVITEPALTNCNILLPDPDFHDGLRRLTRQHGALLCYDEAHTYQFAYGGLVRDWNLACDFQVLGKGLGTGIAFALYGMSREAGDFCAAHIDMDIATGGAGDDAGGLATGGTTYASAVAANVAKIALHEVLTADGYARIGRMGARLADGLDEIFTRRGLPWQAFRLGPRSGYCMSGTLPRNHVEALRSLDTTLIDARRVYMANRGIWEAVASAGPQASFAHDAADIEAYLETADAFLGDLLDN